MNTKPESLRVLLVEDSETDAKLISRELRKAGRALLIERVETLHALRDALTRSTWDIVISDWSLLGFSATAALGAVAELGADIPLIIVSGTRGEAAAVDAMRAGARDYVLKDNLARLAPAVERELRAKPSRPQSARPVRASEARFARLTASGIIGICILDNDGGLREANDACLGMLGYSAEELAAGVTWKTLTPAEWTHLDDVAAERLKLQGFAPPWEKQLFRKDGSKVSVFVGIAVLERRERIAFMADLSERKATEERLHRSEEQLRQAQKMEAIGSLAGGIAHDFNNLLSIILSYSSLLARELPSDDPRRAELEQISEAGERAAALTQQLLAFSRRQVLRPKLVDLNQLVANMEKLLQGVVGEAIDLRVIAANGLRKVEVDPDQIDQVITNLAVNARDAMPQGGTLTLTTENIVVSEAQAEETALEAGRYVRLTVTDSGAGMDAATQTRIFEPFFTTKEMGKGTGLGLSTVFGIVQQSGGSVSVLSAPGSGTTFNLYFPSEDRLGFVARTSRPPANELPRGSETVLLVEDDDAVRGIACSILRRHGYHVLEAASGASALHTCEHHPLAIHLLLTDVVMAQMSGPELARRVCATRTETKVLFMSGYTDDSTVHHGLVNRDVDFLPKPFTPDSLMKKVRHALDTPIATLLGS